MLLALRRSLVGQKIVVRSLAASMTDQQQDGQLSAERITAVLRAKFPETDGSLVQVEDTSGGCGAMFHVRVESPQFDGVSRVNQQKMINQVLREQIKNMHGITMETKAKK